MNASEKQIAFLTTLMDERVHEFELDPATLAKQEASALISQLLSMPRVSQAAQKAAEEGFYIMDGSVYRVVRSKSSGKPYGKVLKISESTSKGSWEYAPGVIGKLAEARVLTVEIAKRMGAQYGICMVCGATLTDPESVDRGIGPICANKI